MDQNTIAYYLNHQCFRGTLNEALRAHAVKVENAPGTEVSVMVRSKGGKWVVAYRAKRLKAAKIWIAGFIAGRTTKDGGAK